MDPLKYGMNPISVSDNVYIVAITALTCAKINVQKGENHVEIFKSGDVILSYIDKFIDDNKFERIIGSNHYIYVKSTNNEYKIDLFSVKKPSRRIKDVKIDEKINTKLITMDIETLNLENGDLKPYLVTWFDGNIIKSYYLSNFNSSENMLLTAINDLMKVKYHGHKIYLHNFAKFDGVFLLKYLNRLGIINPVINDGRIITIPLRFRQNKLSRPYSITFKDSMLLLSSSLRKLAICFNVNVQKDIFPHKFVNEKNLNYVGNVPDFKYFYDITYEEYLDYCSRFNNN